MTQGLWKKSFIAAAVLLVVFIVLTGVLWQQLNDTNTLLNAVKSGMDSLQAERDQMVSDYARLRNELNLRGGYKRNGPYLITPDDPEIAAKVLEITGGYDEEDLWKDYARLYQWTMRNIKYSLDSPTPILPESVDGTLEWGKDFWRTPVETIRDGTGDCEDVSVMLASMMLNYNQRRYPVCVVGIQTTGADAKAHVAVAILNEGDLLSIFDVTSRYWTPFSEVGGFGAQPIPEALDHWFNHLKDEMPGAQVYEIFSENYYWEFTGNQQFIEWASSVY
ncbi:MAG TPA: transglutaminase-like domain-containing protein [Dehalococcoidales bacterium]|nr:transglutaminase-like domain-containing protein [Dehalococcoidales bacterium]